MATLFNEIKQLRNTAELSLKERGDMLRRIYKISPIEIPKTSKSFVMNLAYMKQLGTRFATIAVLVGLTGGIGLTAAADNSLPKELLYPLKIHITEPVRELTHISQNSKVAFQKEIINERFDEAAALARTGNLDVETEAALTEHVKSRIEKVKTLSNSIISVEEQLALSTDLKNIIETKSNELASVIENDRKQEIESEEKDNSVKNTTLQSDNEKDKKEEESDAEKTTVLTSSLLAVADVIVEDIKVTQSATIEEVAKDDPTKAQELSEQVYAQDFAFLTSQAMTNLGVAHVNIASLELLVPGASQATVATLPVTEPTAPVTLPDTSTPGKLDSVPVITTEIIPTVTNSIKDLVSPTSTETATPITPVIQTTSEELIIPEPTTVSVVVPKEKTNLEKYNEFKIIVDELDSKLIILKSRQPSEQGVKELKELLASVQEVNNGITNLIETITIDQEKNDSPFISSSITSLSEAEAKENEIKVPSNNPLENI